MILFIVQNAFGLIIASQNIVMCCANRGFAVSLHCVVKSKNGFLIVAEY